VDSAYARDAVPQEQEIIPVIEMENVRLTDAIRNLARQARVNILLDPRLLEAPFDGATVTFRWEKVTAREALSALLDNHGLVMVETPGSALR
jgi:hypothetical protein